MTTYNTGNPLGSVDVRDLYDNAQNADNFNNGPLDAYPDRFGVSRQSLQGIRNASQYVDLGPYGPGLVFTSRNQVFSYLGEFYATGPAITLPYTTTGAGAGEIANFRSVGDAILRSDLADPDNGSALVAFKSDGAGAVARTIRDKGLEFVSLKDFGAVGDGIADDSDAVQAAMNYGGAIRGLIGETYRITKTIDITKPTRLRDAHILANTAGTFTAGYPKYKAMLYPFGVTGLSIEGCKFTADGSYTGYLINPVDCNDVHIEGNTFAVTSSVQSATCVNLTRKNNDVNIVGNKMLHEAGGASDGGGCIWVRNIVAEGDIVNKSKRIVIAGNTIVKNSTDEAIWIAGNNGITEDVLVYGNILTVSGATSAITVFPGKFGTTSNTTTVNRCTIASNLISGSLSDTAIKVGEAGSSGTTMDSINVHDNIINLSSALYGIRKDTVGLTNSSAYDNTINIASGAIRSVMLFNYQYGNRFSGTFSSASPAVLPAADGGITYGSDSNRWPANLPLTLRFLGTTAGQAYGIKFSGGFVGEDKSASLLVKPKFASANGLRMYQTIDTTDVTQASLQNDGAAADKFFGPADDNATKLGLTNYRWSTIYAGSGTINTSDAREKQQVSELSAAERAVAVKLKGLVRTFKFNDAVAEKGEGARIHFGVIAQEVKAAFESEGLVAESYAILCHDEWPAQQELTDDEGNITQPAKPAGDRYGVRYEELLMFIISAM